MDADCDCIIFCVRAAGYTPWSGREHQDSLEAPREGSREEEKTSGPDCCCVGMSQPLCCWHQVNQCWRNMWPRCSPALMLLQGCCCRERCFPTPSWRLQLKN